MLPPEVTRIHMDFAVDIHDGHYGPRYHLWPSGGRPVLNSFQGVLAKLSSQIEVPQPRRAHDSK